MVSTRYRHLCRHSLLTAVTLFSFTITATGDTLKSSLAPQAGNPQIYAEMRAAMDERYAAHQDPIDAFIRARADASLPLTAIPGLQETFATCIAASSAEGTLSRCTETLSRAGGRIQVIFVADADALPRLTHQSVWGHSGTYITVFALDGEAATETGRRRIAGRIFHEMRARSTAPQLFFDNELACAMPSTSAEMEAVVRRARIRFERSNLLIERQIVAAGRITDRRMRDAFAALRFDAHPSTINRDYLTGRFSAGYDFVPVHPLAPDRAIICAINLSDLGAEIRDNAVVCGGKNLRKARALMPTLALSGVGTVYLYGGLYEMSTISKRVHDNPAHDRSLRVVTAGKTTILIGNYPTQHETIAGIELKDSFGNPFSIYGMHRFNPALAAGDAALAREEFIRTAEAAHTAGMRVMTDFIPWLSPDAIDETNYRWVEHKELGDDANDAFRRLRTDEERAIWLKELLLRPENRNHFAVRITEAGGPERIVLVKHLVSIGCNVDQTRPDPMNEEVQHYYIASLNRLVDLGVDAFRVDLAFFLLMHGLPDEEQPLKKVIDAVRAHARSQGKEVSFTMEAYGNDERHWLERLGADQVYSKRLFDTYWNIVRGDSNAADIHDAVWEALYTPRHPCVFPSNYDQTALAAIGGGTRGFAMLLIAIAHLQGTPVMFDLRDWLLHRGHVIKMPGGSTEPDNQSQHLFVTGDELAVRTNFDRLRKAVAHAPLETVMQDFHRAIETREERWIWSPPTSRPDRLFTLFWKTERGDWTALVVNLKTATASFTAALSIPHEVRAECTDGALVTDMLASVPRPESEMTETIDLAFAPGEEYKIYTIRKADHAERLLTAELARVTQAIDKTLPLTTALPAMPNGREYTIRYNETALTLYGSGALVEPAAMKKIFDVYASLMSARLGGAPVKAIAVSEGSGEARPLIAIECRDTTGRLIGTGAIDSVDGLLPAEVTLRLIEMANVAFAVASLPVEPDLLAAADYGPLIALIEEYYRILTGTSLSIDEILKDGRIIRLPAITPLPPERLHDYYEDTLQQLARAA